MYTHLRKKNTVSHNSKPHKYFSNYISYSPLSTGIEQRPAERYINIPSQNGSTNTFSQHSKRSHLVPVPEPLKKNPSGGEVPKTKCIQWQINYLEWIQVKKNKMKNLSTEEPLSLEKIPFQNPELAPEEATMRKKKKRKENKSQWKSIKITRKKDRIKFPPNKKWIRLW